MVFKHFLPAPLNSVEAPDPFHLPACDAVVEFVNSVETHGPNDKGGSSRVPVESVVNLMDATQSYCVRTLYAEMTSRNNFFIGLAGGAIIGASIVGLVSFIRKNKKRNAA